MLDQTDDYSLSRTDILECFEDDQWFRECMGRFYQSVAREWGCGVTVSARRLMEASTFYSDDMDRTLEFGMDPKDRDLVSPYKSPELSDIKHQPPVLDHFKHAAILAFWLRRIVPINEVWPIDGDGQEIEASSEELTPAQRHFLRYGNELCALLAGFKIALNHFLQDAETRVLQEDREAFIDQLLANIALPERFVFEYPRLLKHKNISSHALYMTYCSLFEPVVRTSSAVAI